MLATAFASDTPLWVTNLIRQYGVHYIWQYWSLLIGAVLSAVYFGKLWRRLELTTDVELLERRYSGKSASILRGWSGATGAILVCPLYISWVTKAMVIISQETLGLPDEFSAIVTIVVIAVAIMLCASSGLFGVVYTDFLFFVIATFGTLIFAYIAVQSAGGLDALVSTISTMDGEQGRSSLQISPNIGPYSGQMSIWNAIGYFCILWMIMANSGGAQAQRILACQDTKNACFALFMFAMVYYAVIAWPWILVALSSIVLLPDIGSGDQASAYPKMIVTVLPAGLRGLVIAGLMAAFVSTMSTMFNWGSSYLVNDVYRRFIAPNGSERDYVRVARLATVFLGLLGAFISFLADSIQQLLSIQFVVASSTVVVILLRWLWWRQNAMGELAGVITTWVLGSLLLFGKVFDGLATRILGLEDGVEFSTDPNLLGARMLFVTGFVTLISIAVSLITRPTDQQVLRSFILSAQPLKEFWRPALRELGVNYHAPETLRRTTISWILGTTAVAALLFGIGELLLGTKSYGIAYILLSAILSAISVNRIRSDTLREDIFANK